jgi:hypothetical protein
MNNKNEIMNEKIIDIIFITIASFLPIKNIYSGRFVCKKWYYILISKLTKKIITYKIPNKVNLIRKEFIGIYVINTSNINNRIFFSGFNTGLEFVIYDYDKKKFFDLELSYFSSNSKFICGYRHQNIKIFNLEFQELNKWNCDNINDLTVDENYIYVVGDKICYVYDFKGNKINYWNISEKKEIGFPKIRVNNNKIYVSINDESDNWIKIFSNEGKCIRDIHISKNMYNDLIAFQFYVSSSIIYVLDYTDNSIKFFTCDGDLISKFVTSNLWCREECEKLNNLIVIEDNLYIYRYLYLYTFKLFFQ